MTAILRRPRLLAAIVAAAAQALFAWRLGVPSKPVFDEVHYVPAARTLWALARPTNPEHPLFGKLAVGAGIALFGDDAMGWRAAATLAGTATVVAVFAILWLMYRAPRPALLGAGLATLNFTVFVEARIAMLDGVMAALVATATAMLLWAMRAEGPAVARRWTLGAALLGLAIGTKWTALPYLGLAALGFVGARAGDPTRWPGLGLRRGWLILGGVAAAAYLLTFAPAFFYADRPLTLATLLPFQREMFALQTQVLPPHPYQSSWYGWPFDARPIWYLYEQVEGAQRGILYLVNPGIAAGGLVAVPACLWAWARDCDVRAGAAAAIWLASWLMWGLIPKSLGFFYYYHLSSVWVVLAIVAAFRHWQDRLHWWDEAYLAVVAALFVHFYPILAARPLAGPASFLHWMWLRSWI